MRDISDPEHPYTLEQLQVVREEHIQVDDAAGHVMYERIYKTQCATTEPMCFPRVEFTPTVQHCSMATLIGLCLRVKLMQALPARFKVCTVAPHPVLVQPTINDAGGCANNRGKSQQRGFGQ